MTLIAEIKGVSTARVPPMATVVATIPRSSPALSDAPRVRFTVGASLLAAALLVVRQDSWRGRVALLVTASAIVIVTVHQDYGANLVRAAPPLAIVGLTVAIVPSPAWFRRSEPVTRPLGW